MIRRTYALTQQDIANIQRIKEKCSHHSALLNDSHIVRLAIQLATQLTEKTVVKAWKSLPKMKVGRPEKGD